MKTIKFVGIGLCNEEFLTEIAKQEIKKSELVLTTSGLYQRMSEYLDLTGIFENSKIDYYSVDEISKIVFETTKNDISILVSGDVGFFSLSSTIKDKIANICEQNNYDFESFKFESINGISSFQYFFAKLNERYDDVKLLSAHGRNVDIVAYVTYNPKLFVLAGGENSIAKICEQLNSAGFGELEIIVGENLGCRDEKISKMSILEAKTTCFASLSVVFIVNPKFADKNIMIKDNEFIRSDKGEKIVPMTKEEVRWVSVDKLDIKPDSIVFDIGAGTGSVSLEMAKKASNSSVYAIEHNSEAIKLIKKNIDKFGIRNVQVIDTTAPNGFENLPSPDRVFIGGSSGNLSKILLSLMKDSTSGFKVVVNAVSLETIVETFNCLENLDFENVEYSMISTSKSKKIGNYNMMIGLNPIYIVYGEYRKEDLK